MLHHEGPEAWEADKAQREMLLNEFIPYMKRTVPFPVWNRKPSAFYNPAIPSRQSRPPI